MNHYENLILDRINNAGKNTIDSEWLRQSYSPSLSIELKKTIAERIGTLSKEGWSIIKLLINQYGIQQELIYAAGICHQPEAKNWLIKILKSNEEFDIEILQALKCWGGSFSKKFLKKILNDPKHLKRLAGLELLSFKAYQLSDSELLELTKNLLNDSHDQVIISTIKILQRRDGEKICNQIIKVTAKGSDSVIHATLIALGAIGTECSYKALSQLTNQLPAGALLDLAHKQLDNQYRFTETITKSTIK